MSIRVKSFIKHQIDDRTRKVYNFRRAGVAELADAEDLKSSARKSLWVRDPPPASPYQYITISRGAVMPRLILILAYLLGSIPTAYIAGR